MSIYSWQTAKFNELVGLHRKQRFHHASLLLSEPGAGEKEFGLALAKSLLCLNISVENSKVPCGECKSCLLLNADSHPDFHIIQSDKPKIGVDLVRKTIESISKTAQMAGNKVVFIAEIDCMTEAAANAFLKTLEEPTDDTFIVMTSCAQHLLLPTIKSRCEKHSLKMPSYLESTEYFKQIGEVVPSEPALKAFGNSPLLYLLRQKESGISFEQYITDLEDAINLKLGQAEFVRKYAAEPRLFIDFLYAFLLSKMSTAPSNDTVRISSWLESELLSAKRRLQQSGTNKHLLLSALFASLIALLSGNKLS